MKNQRTTHRPTPVLLAAATIFVVWTATPADACDVPVFRYALERWPASFYNVLVFHRGELTGDANATVEWLKGLSDDANRPCNLAVRPFDVSAAESPDANARLPKIVEPVWQKYKDKPLPYMVACFPGAYGKLIEAWSGPVTRAAASRLADSPARQKLVENLLGGDSAVWILLECGNRAKDDAAANMLNKQLAALGKQMALPNAAAPDAALDGVDYEVGPKLRIGFSFVRVSRSNPAEAALVRMLLATEDDLTEVTADEPAAFPVFGQGRALLALVGAGIGEENIAEYAGFLCGPCSCMVKDQNPGVDLLIAADWFAPFRDAPTVTAPLPGAIAPPEAEDLAATTQPVLATPTGQTPTGAAMSPLMRNLLIAAVAIVAVGIALGLLASRRTPGSNR